MKIIPYLVNWQELTLEQLANAQALALRLKRGKVAADTWNFPDSYSLYMNVAEAYEQMRPSLPDLLRQRIDQFMQHLISFDGYCQDLGSVAEVALSLSPESALKLAYIGNQINWEGLEPVYYRVCASDTQESLAQFNSVSAEVPRFIGRMNADKKNKPRSIGYS
jgi:hypothetical protein